MSILSLAAELGLGITPMFPVHYLFYLILLHVIVAPPQINLYYTDSINENDQTQQHHCLRIAAHIEQANINRQLMTYCMSEFLPPVNISDDSFSSKFTFAELAKQNIISHQLYLWSAPIDLIERYQLYLNQLNTSNHSSLSTDVFYNCTMPRFGPMCEYELHSHQFHHSSSLYEIIGDFYLRHPYEPSTFTCYTHLKCDRGPSASCLDWSEICDGNFDCLNGEVDEEHCWQLDIHQCKDNEYQCWNGQCIPQSFYRDDENLPDCLDTSDEDQVSSFLSELYVYSVCEPSFKCEDVTCKTSPLTSSCVQKRTYLLSDALFSVTDPSVPSDCWSALKCLMDMNNPSTSTCLQLCSNHDYCVTTIKRRCPEMLFIPAVPVLFGHIYFAYRTSDAHRFNEYDRWNPYVCYNNSHYDVYFTGASKVFFNNTTCYYRRRFPTSRWGSIHWYNNYLGPLQRDLWEYHPRWKYNPNLQHLSAKCNRSNMYQCAKSLRCIPNSRLLHVRLDCPRGDSENTSESDRILKEEESIGISEFYDEKSRMKLRHVRRHVSFQTICDGFIELWPTVIEERNETDETECDQWQCNNIYTRCDEIWNCPNGVDEINCNFSLSVNCPLDQHLCVSPQTNQFICLPIDRVKDGHVDCLGASDEPNRCLKTYHSYTDHQFYCTNESASSCVRIESLCNSGLIECATAGDDEQFCQNRTAILPNGICYSEFLATASAVEKFLCNRTMFKIKQQIKYFTLNAMANSGEDPYSNLDPILSIYELSAQHSSCCHRGLDLRIWLSDKNMKTRNTCLCPPSFYGDQCQYQNQRISLVIRFRISSDSWQTIFAVVVSLIDRSDDGIIHSTEQFSYLSMRDCQIKFNMYLLYSTRPKNATKNYSIHLDFYEKVSLDYRGSVLLPVNFSFLPVHRLAFIVDIPPSFTDTHTCSDVRCVHGRCIKYANSSDGLTFCECDKEWSGRWCTIAHNCTCASGSLCLGITAHNRSICVCRLNKFGPRCYLDSICQTNVTVKCENGGQCVPHDDYMVSDQKFTCICPKRFTGNRCQFAEKQIILSFDQNIILSQSIFIHFIEVIHNHAPVRTTIFRNIPVQRNSISIYRLQPFHLVWIELLDHTYYLTMLEKTDNRSTNISRMIVRRSDRCPHIRELFNQTFVRLPLLHRVKFYHLPCQERSLNLSCFYDDIHLCLCYTFGEKQLANCFEFQHNMTFDCLGQSVCKNDARCIPDSPYCPTRSICICPACFYGLQCQFSTYGFALSLDAILGYHITPRVALIDQAAIVQFALTMTIIFTVAGLIDSFFSISTFKNKPTQEVGCGLYLLGSSITTLLITIIFTLKFFILLFAQMTMILNRTFLQVQCHSIDFLLRVGLNMDQWLNACVAVERAITTVKATGFNKNKSKRAAKRVIIVLLIVIIGTCVHDPIHRQLIDENNNDDDGGDDQNRIWCIVNYSSTLKIYDNIVHVLHFFGPFLINLISAIILITNKSRQQLYLHKQRSYREHLREQCRQHRHLFTAPILLFTLALPRLILTFISKCMKSTNDSWLFLIGYLISLIPPMLTFMIFILPSKLYRKECGKSLAYYRTYIQQRWHRIF